MIWTRSDTLGIANHDCFRCHGLGLAGGRLESTQPCPCVLKAIFRACHEKFRDLVVREKPLVRREIDEDYMADFVAIARRVLSPQEMVVFRAHFLLGGSSRYCMHRLAIDPGAFYQAINQIEQRVGRALRETQPHALYPIDEYFRLPNAKH